jgi:hypothetical protein
MPCNIAHLWGNHTQNWNFAIIINLFSQQAQQAILKVPKVMSQEEYILRWTLNPKGICSTNEAYRFLNTRMQAQLPPQLSLILAIYFPRVQMVLVCWCTNCGLKEESDLGAQKLSH